MTEDLRKRIVDTIAQRARHAVHEGQPRDAPVRFSAAVVGILKETGVTFESYNILADPDLREGLKEYSSWPTYPQLYVDGKLVGGADIVRELHAKGELATLLTAQG